MYFLCSGRLPCKSVLFTNLHLLFFIFSIVAGPVVEPSMQYTLLSTRDADPPQFTHRFNSSYGPPTAVECTVDGSTLNSSLYTVSREVKSPHFSKPGVIDTIVPIVQDTPDVTEVTVTVNVRQGGVYRCNVTVLGRNVSSPQQVVTLGTGYSTANIKGEYIVHNTFSIFLSSIQYLEHHRMSLSTGLALSAL